MSNLHLFQFFKNLVEENSWDVTLSGGESVCYFSTANRNHADEFIGLVALLPELSLKENPANTTKWGFIVYKTKQPAVDVKYISPFSSVMNRGYSPSI